MDFIIVDNSPCTCFFNSMNLSHHILTEVHESINELGVFNYY